MPISPTKSVCLNMIVRNEASIITRLLNSVAPLVSEYVIVDTGSTDDTIECIRRHPLPGVVLQQPFVNFGVSRTMALEQARVHSTCDYLLLLDADMELVVCHPLPELVADAYYISQRSGLLYQNIRLVRRTLDVHCVGATHEYYELPHRSTVHSLPETTIYINDHGDGGCKSDKFERDLRLLGEELRQDPGNPRTVFYLAQTCHDTGLYQRAIGHYMHRIALGGWDQEVHYSKFRIALCHIALKQWNLAQLWATMAHEDGRRAEPGYYMCKAFREDRKYELAYYFYLLARSVPKPSSVDCLFIEEAVYNYLLDFEECVLWYYVHPKLLVAGLQLSLRFLDKNGIPDSLRSCIASNMTFYTSALAATGHTRLYHDEDATGVWRYSSPAWLDDGTLYCRLVNYHIRDDGSYELQQANVDTRLLVDETVIDTIENASTWYNPEAHIRGLEDTRILRDPTSGVLYTLSASMEYARRPGTVAQVVGRLDLTAKVHTVLAVIQSPFDRTCEKNWVVAGSLERVVYEWYPDICIGCVHIAEERLEIIKKIPVPGSFLGMRGSTNGVLYHDEWWFVTHMSIDNRDSIRKYLHRIVVLDRDLTQVRRATMPFTFEPGANVEYCLGFEINEQGVARFGYSIRDRHSTALCVNLCELEIWFQ